MPTLKLPKKCPHHKEWDECCLEELLEMNPWAKREDIRFDDGFIWITTKGYAE